MKKLLLVSSVIVLLAAGCSKAGTATSSDSSSSSAGTASAGTKLSDEPYANFAYEINPNNLSDAAKQATQGFNISSQTLANGDTKVNLAPTNTEYHAQSYELKPGQKLYFIEQNLGDDANGQDRFPADDTAVIVDPNGHVVQQ